MRCFTNASSSRYVTKIRSGEYNKRGRRKRIVRGFDIREVAVPEIPCVMLEAPSKTPTVGFTATPITPFANPFTKPLAPSLLAPLYGCVTKPDTPNSIPCPIAFVP